MHHSLLAQSTRISNSKAFNEYLADHSIKFVSFSKHFRPLHLKVVNYFGFTIYLTVF